MIVIENGVLVEREMTDEEAYDIYGIDDNKEEVKT